MNTKNTLISLPACPDERQVQASALGLAQGGVRMVNFDTHYDYQKLRARLDLFDESIVLTHYDPDEDVATTSYEVDPASLAAAFTGTPLSTGLLPENCLFYTQQNGRQMVAIYIPPKVHELAVKAEQLRTYTLPLPGLVFCGCGTKYKLFAVKQRPTEPGAPLFNAPLPNVYSQTAQICFGDVSVPVCQTNTIHQAAKMFFQSQFNLDLVGHKSRRHSANVLIAWREVEALLEKEALDAYPLDDLAEARLKLEDLWA